MSREMKESGIEWIGEIPEHWKVERLGQYFTNRNTKVSDKDYPPLSTTKQGILPQLESVAKTNANDDRKLVMKGDFVINSRSDRKQSCGLSDLDGSVSLINIVITPSRNDILPCFTKLILNNYGFAEEFYRWGNGIVADLWSTKWDLMKRISIPIPPINEQQAIANHLDTKCAEIDHLIALQEEMIAELKVYKQSVITEAVCKGLNKNVPMKESGIEWIGEIPNLWDITRLRFICTINTGNKDTINKEDDGLYPFYVRSPKIERISTYSYDGEAILMAGDGVGAGKVFHYINGKFDYHQRVYNLHKFKNVVGKYLHYYLMSNFWRKIEEGNAKSTVDSVRLPMLLDFHVCVPPLPEQQAIADYLDRKCTQIDALISIKQQKAEELKEYKKSMIYEYVTGKKEVI